MRIQSVIWERIANEILMHFRSMKKTAGDVSLSDPIDFDGDGNSLSFMDIIAEDMDLLEDITHEDTCLRLRGYVDSLLTRREADIICMRYGLNGQPPKTQRETADICGISRSYVSRRHECKRCPESLENTGLSGHRSC